MIQQVISHLEQGYQPSVIVLPVQAQVNFQLVAASSTPRTIAASAVLQFTATLPTGMYYQNGDVITFNVPSPGSFTPASGASYCTSLSSPNITVSSCQIYANSVVIGLTVTLSTTKLQINVSNFKNPSYTTTISSITTQLVDSSATTRATSTQATWGTLLPDVLKTANIEALDNQIGGQNTSIKISLTPKNTLQSTGKIIVYFPLWNPQASFGYKHQIMDTNPHCTGVTLMKTSLTCVYNADNQLLTVTNLFSSGSTSGQLLEFTVDSFLNPYSAVPRTGYYIYTTEANNGQIDSSKGSITISLSVTNWASFTTANIGRTDGIKEVGEQSEGDIYFEMSLPIDANCRLKIVFPDDQPVTSALTKVSGVGILQTNGMVTPAAVNIASNYIYVDGCSSYQDSPISAEVFLSHIVNSAKVMNTQTFEIYLYALSGSPTTMYPIAMQNYDIIIQDSMLQPGQINTFTVVGYDSQTVQDQTKYQITMKPDHSIPNSSKIIIQFPSTIPLTSGACSLSSTTGGISSSASCSINSNIVTITNPFGSSGSYSQGGAAFTFVLSTSGDTTIGTNPASVKDAGSFEVSTFATISGTDYAIDDSTLSNVYKPTVAVLTASLTSVSSKQTSYTPSSYTLQLSPQKNIPSNGQLLISFPTEVTLPTGTSTITSCTYSDGTTTKSLKSIATTSTSPIKLTINDAFTSGLTASGQTISITCDGLQNPRTTATTSSFSVSTTDQSGNLIESKTTGITTAMTTFPELTEFVVTPTSTTNGQVTQYQIKVTSSISMKNTDKITFTFPPEVTVPSSPSCAIGSMVLSATCTTAGSSRISAQLTFSSNPLTAGTEFYFYVNGITNPPSTQPTSSFTLIIGTDSSNNKIQAYSQSVTVRMTTPATATGTSLAQSSKDLGTAATYSIQYNTANPMPANSAFLITYPSAISITSLSICKVTYSGTTYTTTCQVDNVAHTVKVTGLPVAVTKGGTIKIDLGNIKNPSTQVPSQIFTVLTYTDSSLSYTVDTFTGITIQYACTFPCATCASPSQPTSCTSCFTKTEGITQKYLAGGVCKDACPEKTYPDDNLVCQACKTECKTCIDGQTCATCNQTGMYPYLYNSKCIIGCVDGTFPSSYQCKPCDANCLKCASSATKCTACDQYGKVPFLSNSQCVSKCDTGYVSVNFQCKQCTAPCTTCVTSQTTCTACSTGYLYGSQCVAKCPAGTTQTDKKCLGCDPRCLQCSPTDTTKCLQCSTGYYLFNNLCVAKCPDGYKVDTSGIFCQQNTVKPNNTNNGTNNGSNNGNGTNNGGGGTIVVPGQYIVDSKSSDTYVYFPVTITQAILGGVSVGSFFKDHTSLIHSNALALWGPLETIAYGAQIYLSYNQLVNQQSNNSTADSSSKKANSTNSTNSTSNSTKTNSTKTNSTKRMLSIEALTSMQNDIMPLVFYGTSFAFVIKIITNFIFIFIFMVIIRKDPGYQEYRKVHCCSPMALAIFGTVLSFKLYKFFYSRFFGLDRFFIPLENPQRMHKTFNILTIINIVLSLCPVIAIDIYGILKYHWGNQFYIILIESLILAVSMLVLQIIEMRQQKKFMYSITKDNVYNQVGDMSSAMDDEIMKRLDEEMRKKFGGQTLEEFIEKLKLEQMINDQEVGRHLRRAKSMIDLGNREKEEDERRVNTDPLDSKKQQIYDQRPNPFQKNFDEYPDNCYAEPAITQSTPLDPSQQVKKIIQSGEKAMTDDEYERDFHKRMGLKVNLAEERKGDRNYGKMLDDFDETPLNTKKKRGMRGRKGKYYSQVDDEDQTFLENEKNNLNKNEDGENIENLQMIEEESHQSVDQDQIQTGRKSDDASIKGLQATIDLEDQIIKDQAKDKQQLDKLPDEIQENFFEAQENVYGEGSYLQSQPQKEPQNIGKGQEFLDNNDKGIQNNQQVELDKNNKDLQEDDILKSFDKNDKATDAPSKVETQKGSPLKELSKESDKEKEQMMLHKPNMPSIDEDQIIKEHENEDEETGQPDSDDDDDQRIRNMVDPDKKRFNVNDILGDFDRDEKGNPLILQDKRGSLIDKDGNRVNEKGYLIDSKTGDVLEKEKKRKVFDFSDLDERGELPPPFNLERFNFNAHDVRGYLDRDTNGNEIAGNRKDQQGNLIDRLGRKINPHGYLVDNNGNLVDKRGRIKLNKHLLDQVGGEIPQLFNYKGKKFDIKDVMGDLDKDRNGNMIIRRDYKNQMVDKKGRRVNCKGYLVDEEGNVISKDGKMIFERFALSKDDEIPKLFPFLKFNIEEIKGDYEMDPLGNPMLQKTRDGNLVDSKGRRVNDKGYLLDDTGNVVNKRKRKVFNRSLLEDDGDIPKIFRTGLLRKDTFDSFSQLMSEIEDLERMQEMDQNDPKLQEKIKNKMKQENERLQKKIDKIVEEDNDDDDLLMKELEDLAKDGGASDGGNTSVDSMMEDTPSNYNAANMRFNEVEEIKNRAKRNARQQQKVQEDEEYSEYSYLPDRKTKKKKKKKKKKKTRQPQEPEIDERELKMAKAYGGLSQAQYDKLVQMKRMQQSQLNSRDQSFPRQASNTQMTSLNPRPRPSGVQMDLINKQHEDFKSEWDGSQLDGGRAQQLKPHTAKRATAGFSVLRDSNSNPKNSSMLHQEFTQEKLGKKIPKNNLMSSQNNMDQYSQEAERQKSRLGDQNQPGSKHRRLSNVANSVSGFYKDNAQSEHNSQISRTHESNTALDIGQARKFRKQGQQQEEEKKISPRKDLGPPSMINDQELDRIYGTARGGLGDMTMLSDWEKDSQGSGKSALSQFTQTNTMKVKGLESIYLQRLEPATKNGKRQHQRKNSQQAKFRIMHHKYHDEPEWYIDDNRDELDSVLSGNYKEMEKRFEQEFQGSSSKGTKKQRIQENHRINIFHGNLKQYKEKKYKDKVPGVDLAK